MTITETLSLHFCRSVAVSTKAKTIYGYAIVYNSASADLGGYVEVIARDAFTEDLATGKKIVALYEHESQNVLGDTESGTLKLTPDDKGIAFELELPDTDFGQYIYDQVKAGTLDGMSFAFRASIVQWDLQKSVKTVIKGTMTEITVTSSPAYEATVALTRSKKSQEAKKESEPLLSKEHLDTIDANLHRLKML